MIESAITEKIKELLPQKSSRIPSLQALGLESSENYGHPWPQAEGLLLWEPPGLRVLHSIKIDRVFTFFNTVIDRYLPGIMVKKRK
jgi:hypothetical protein